MQQIFESLRQVDLQFVVYISAFVGVLLIIEGLRQLLSRSANAEQAICRRLQRVQEGASTEEILKIL